MNRRILNHFSIEEKRTYINDQFKLYSQDIQNAIKDRELLAMIGPAGAGKTTVFRHAANALRINPDRQPLFVYVRNHQKEKMSISSVINAIIFDMQADKITDEKPRHDLEARSRQVIRLLGKVYCQLKRDICIVIEEGHRLHFNTFRAIKELREAEFAGETPLFSTIIIGHETLGEKMRARSEVYWRTQMQFFNESAGWMQFDERLNYLRAVYGQAITQGARNRIASLYRQPLEMDWYVENKMLQAYHAGLNQLTEEAFAATPAEMKEALKVSLADIEKEAKEMGSQIGRTTVKAAIEGTASPEKQKVVGAALDRLATKMNREGETPVEQIPIEQQTKAA